VREPPQVPYPHVVPLEIRTVKYVLTAGHDLSHHTRLAPQLEGWIQCMGATYRRDQNTFYIVGGMHTITNSRFTNYFNSVEAVLVEKGLKLNLIFFDLPKVFNKKMTGKNH